MSLLSNLKTILTVKKAVDYAKKNPHEITDMKLKPGLTTSTFWTLILSQILLAASALFGQLDGEIAVIIGSVLTAAYTWIRNGFKLRLGMRFRPGVKTSEFWAMAVTSLLEISLAALDKVDGTWATLAAAALAAIYKASRLSMQGMEINQATK